MQHPSRSTQSLEALFAEYVSTRDADARAEIIERQRVLVRTLAYKFLRPGVSVDDLIQSGWIALINAVDRFDPSFDTKFTTYATHCVVGQIKRYFRDHTWAVRAPRHLQEIAGNLPRVQDALCTRLGREPSVPEMAAEFGVSAEELLQAMELHRAYQPLSLDDRTTLDDGSDSMPLGEAVGTEDADLEAVVEQVPLRSALRGLDARRRKVLQRRFFDGCSQQEVADELGLSQMHVSRLERSALKQLRAMLQEAYPAALAA